MSGQYVNDSGMVIRSDAYSEYDRRVVLLTKDHGKITAFAKGARRQNNKLMAATDLFWTIQALSRKGSIYYG